MNARSYKTVFSKRLGALVAVGEHASSQGKANGAGSGGGAGASGTLGYIAALTASFALVSLAWAAPATNALPNAGQVVQGAASMSQTASQMTINQGTQRAAINWQSFDIGAQAKVQVVQPNSQAVLLNRVVGQSPSQIFGQLQANGHVILVNPNGVLFGKDGSVNAGSFTASTLGISDANFMAGNMVYERNGSTAGIVNEGTITTAPGGYVALLGASVSNQGQINTQGGNAFLGAADTIKVPVSSTGRIKLELTAADMNANVSNTGSIITQGGQVYMQALALNQAAAQIIQSGSIDTTGEKGGAVNILADGGKIRVSGSVTANSTDGSAGGDVYIGRDKDTNVLAAVGDVRGAYLESTGGFVETSGQYLATNGVSVKAKDWLLDPTDIRIVATDTTTFTNTDSSTAGTTTTFQDNGTPPATSEVLVGTIQGAINNGTNVTITTTNIGTQGSGAGNITIVNALNLNNTGPQDATLSLIADNGIIQNAAISGSGTKLVNIRMEAKGNYQGIEAPSTNSDGININANISTNGNITLIGSTTKDNNEGVYIGGVTLKAQNIDITGTSTGAGVPGSIEHTKGIRSFGTLIATDKITLKGTSTNVTGVGLEGGSVTAGGAVLIEGKATSGIYQGTNIGFNVTGASVKITGETRDNLGVGIGANVTATTGDVIIEGKSVNGRGVDINSGKVVKATEGDVKITGTSTNARGIDVGNQTAYAPVAQIIAGKNIILDGTGKAGGVRVWGDSVLKAGTFTPAGVPDVLGDINITGTSSASDGVNFWRFPKAARFEASQDIIINGTANGVSGSGFTTTTSDLNAQAPMMIAGRDFKLTATNSNTGNTGNVINGQSGLQVTAVGDIKLNAIKPNSTGNAIYFYSQTNALGGNASFKSTNSNGDVLIQANQGGIIFQNAYSKTGLSGTYTSLTDISGRNVTIDNTGGTVTVDASGKATLVQGLGTSTTNGLNLASTVGIKIDAKENINLSAKSTGAAGVLLGGPITVNAAGDVNIKGTTTSAALPPNPPQGVFISGTSSVEGKNVDIEGNAVNGNGVLSYAAITATATKGGSATITGTSTGTGGSASALSLWANVTADQNVTLKGTNGTNINTANTGAAVYIDTNKEIKATNGKIDVTASTSGAAANALQIFNGAKLTAATEIKLKADTLSISNTAAINAGAGAGKVTITTDSDDAKINIGAADAGSATTSSRTLGLLNAELNRITAGNLVIGDASNVGGITVSAATTTNATTGNVTLQTGGNIAVNAALTVGNSGATKNVTLNGAGFGSTLSSISQTAAIKAAGLELLGTNATHTLTNTGNDIKKLAGNTGTVNLTNNANFAIDTVNTGGLTTSGNTTLNSTAAVTQASDANIKAAGLALVDSTPSTKTGTFTLNNDNNEVGTLAANAKTVSYTNKTALAVGDVGLISGVTATGDVSIITKAGDLTLKKNITAANVNLNAAGAVLRDAAVADGIIKASLLRIKAGAGVGISTSRIKTDVVTLSMESASDQYVTEANAVTVAAKSTGRSVNIDVTTDALTVGSSTLIDGINNTTAIDGVSAATGVVLTTQAGDLNINRKISNSASGDVVLGAGVSMNAGVGTGGDVKTTSNMDVTNTNGNTYVYTGSAAGAGLLSDLDTSLSELRLSGDMGVTPLAQNADSYVKYLPGQKIVDGAKAQVMFREKITLDTSSISGVALDKTYGDANTTSSAGDQAALFAQMQAKLKQTNFGQIITRPVGTTSDVNVIKISKAALINDLSGSLSVPTYSTSNHMTAKTHDYGELTSGKYTAALDAAKAQVKVAQREMTGVIAQGSSTYGDSLVTGAVTFNNKVGADVVTPTVNIDTSGKLNVNDRLNAGTYEGLQTVNATGADAANYTFVNVKGNYKVDQRPLTIGTGSVPDKTADGTTTATVNPGDLINLVGNEKLGVAATGTFNNASAGNTKPVNAYYTLQNGANGGLANNYILAVGTPTNPDTRMTGNILSSVNPVVNPTPSPVNNNSVSRVRTVSGFGGAGAATGVLDDQPANESREVCSDLYPENCECLPSVIPTIEICFAPKRVVANKEEK